MEKDKESCAYCLIQIRKRESSVDCNLEKEEHSCLVLFHHKLEKEKQSCVYCLTQFGIRGTIFC